MWLGIIDLTALWILALAFSSSKMARVGASVGWVVVVGLALGGVL